LLAAGRECLSKKGVLELLGPLVVRAFRHLLDEARAQGNDGDSQRRAAQAAIDRLERKLSELSIDSTLLEQRDVIDHLQAGSGGYRQNVGDLPGLVVRAGTLERDLEELRRRLPDGCPLDPDGQSGLTVDQEERIRQLAETRPKLEARLEHATEQVTETTSSLDALRAELGALDAPADVKALVEVATRVRKAGDLEATRTDTAGRLQTVDATLANAMGTLRLDGVDPRAVDAVAVPAVETIRQLHAEFDKLTGTIAQLEDQVAGFDSQRNRTAAELAELLTAEHPPREDDLVAARARRDEGWRLVRGVWIDGSADPEAVETWSNGESLENAYEAAVGGADEVADRLRDEANAVERRMSLERQLEEIDGRLAAERQELERAQADRDADESSWAQLWETVGIVPESRGAMEKWRDDFRNCAQQSVETRRLAAEIGGLDETIARHQTDLVSSLASVGKQPPDGMSLLGLLDHADQAFDPDDDTVPFGALLAFARAPVHPAFAGGEGERGEAIARLGAADFRVLTEVADQGDAVKSLT
jgi:predicted  nucleic acid-binding Zn-ribbon protein